MLAAEALKVTAASAHLSDPDQAEPLQQSVAAIPMGRFCRPDEVAEVALFLASDRASYGVEAVIPMHGGGQPVI